MIGDQLCLFSSALLVCGARLHIGLILVVLGCVSHPQRGVLCSLYIAEASVKGTGLGYFTACTVAHNYIVLNRESFSNLGTVSVSVI